jgi:hypothetical protein
MIQMHYFWYHCSAYLTLLCLCRNEGFLHYLLSSLGKWFKQKKLTLSKPKWLELKKVVRIKKVEAEQDKMVPTKESGSNQKVEVEQGKVV